MKGAGPTQSCCTGRTKTETPSWAVSSQVSGLRSRRGPWVAVIPLDESHTERDRALSLMQKAVSHLTVTLPLLACHSAATKCPTLLL